MPPARKSHARARRNRRVLAVSNPSNRRYPSKSNSVPGGHRSPNAAKHQSLDKRLSWRMVGISRHAPARDVSPRLSTPQPRGKIRSLERSTKSDGRPRLKTKKRQRRRSSALASQVKSTWPSSTESPPHFFGAPPISSPASPPAESA